MSEPFAAALMDMTTQIPSGLRTWNGSEAAHRFNIYRNNVVVSLRSALETAFPITRALVGDAFFAGMARAYLEKEPPRSPVMARYGDTFPEFIAHFAPTMPLRYLADVARLELLRVEAYHAADQAPLDAGAFAALVPEALPSISLRLHPAVRVLRSAYPVVAIFAAHNGAEAFEDVDLELAEDALIARPAMEVMVHRLAPGVAASVIALASGQSIAEAAMSGAADNVAFTPAAMFETLITTGIVTAFLHGEEL